MIYRYLYLIHNFFKLSLTLYNVNILTKKNKLQSSQLDGESFKLYKQTFMM